MANHVLVSSIFFHLPIAAMDESSKCSEVFDYLHNSSYPSGSGRNIKWGIRQRAALFELREGVLFLKSTKRQWIPCRKQQEQIISSCHDDSLGNFACMLTLMYRMYIIYCLVGFYYAWTFSYCITYNIRWQCKVHFHFSQLFSLKYLHVHVGGGHYGWDKTIDKVCTCYYWASVFKDIKAYVGSCEVCQRCNPKLQKQASKLQPIKVNPEVWQQIGIDIISPLKESTNGNKYIITCSDYFSKWVEARAIAMSHRSGQRVCEWTQRQIV